MIHSVNMSRDANKNERLIIYQVLPRLLTNSTVDCVPFGSLGRNGSGKMNHFTPALLKSIHALGVNCIWYTGIIENATKSDFTHYGIQADNPNVVKGEAGSPYAIKDYYDVNPCLAENVADRMTEFQNLVNRTHAEGMKVIIDFVPNHTARQYRSDSSPEGEEDFGVCDDTTKMFAPSNNYYYITSQKFVPPVADHSETEKYYEFPAKATGNDCFTAFPGVNDWYETVKLNYGHDYGNGSDYFVPVPDTWEKMFRILRFWANKGVDGFRCDMIFMVPLAFWHWVIPRLRTEYPDLLFIGEIYDVSLYRAFLDYGCFDYLYDKVNLYDTLVGIERGIISAARLTGAWQTVDGIGDRMLNFLENHDEVRFSSVAYASDPANVVPSLVVSAMMGKGPFMIYFAQELGESAEDNEGFAGDNHRTSIFDYWSYDTMRRWNNSGKWDTTLLSVQERWLRDIYSRVLHLCNESRPLREGQFFDFMYVNLSNPGLDPHSVFAFMRYIREEEAVLVIANFSGAPAAVRLNIPDLAFDMASLPEGNVIAEDLLSGIKVPLTLSRTLPALVEVGPKTASVLYFSLRDHVRDVSELS